MLFLARAHAPLARLFVLYGLLPVPLRGSKQHQTFDFLIVRTAQIKLQLKGVSFFPLFFLLLFLFFSFYEILYEEIKN